MGTRRAIPELVIYLKGIAAQFVYKKSGELLGDINSILSEVGLKYEGKQKIRHMVEVLIEDLGYEELGKPVVKPLDGIKIAGYVDCQTNRPFGVLGESFENPTNTNLALKRPCVLPSSPVWVYSRSLLQLCRLRRRRGFSPPLAKLNLFQSLTVRPLSQRTS